jgi:hypothetical protein
VIDFDSEIFSAGHFPPQVRAKIVDQIRAIDPAVIRGDGT